MTSGDQAANTSFKLPSIRRRLMGGGLWAFCGQAVVLTMVIAKSALLARILPPAAVGAYFLAVTIATVGSMVAVMGLEKSVLQQVAHSLAKGWHSRARRVIHKAFALGAVGSLGLAALLMAGAGYWLADTVLDSPRLSSVIGLTSAWLVLLAMEKLLGETFRGLHDIRGATIFGGTLTAVLTVGFFVFLWLGPVGADLRTAVAVTVVAVGINIVIGAALFRSKLATLRRPPTATADSAGNTGGPDVTVSGLLSIAAPLLVTNVAAYALGQSGMWIIAAFLTEQDVALYGSASQVAALVSVSLVIANKVLPPIIGEFLEQQNRGKLQELLQAASGVAFVPALVVFVVIVGFGHNILEIVFGDFYGAGAIVLLLLASGHLMNVWVGSCGFTLIMSGHQRDLMWITVFTVASGIVGSVVLVRSMGIEGVALATAGARTIQQLLMLVVTRIRCAVWTYSKLGRVPTVIRAAVRASRS